MRYGAGDKPPNSRHCEDRGRTLLNQGSKGIRSPADALVMKNPALTGGVSFQFKLRLTRLLLAPVSDILPNRGFVDADRGGEQSSCPHPTPIPIHLRQIVREFLFEPTTRHALQRLHDLGHRILRRNHQVQMYMIPVHPHLLTEPIGVKFPHFSEHLLEVLSHPRHEDFPPIPGHPHQMVLRLVDDMRLSMKLHQRPS